MRRPAFTMLELVFVIMVVGIISAMAIPRLDRDLKQEAADNILSAIRYTQHLALLDKKHMQDNPKWQQRFWRIVFTQCSSAKGWYYMVGSDDDMEDSTNAQFDEAEAAQDPQNGKPMFFKCVGMDMKDASPSIFIQKKFGVKTVVSSGGCNGAKHIAFDHLGRPHHGTGFTQSAKPDYAGYMDDECRFTFTMSDDDTFVISIEPETGYAYIL